MFVNVVTRKMNTLTLLTAMMLKEIDLTKNTLPRVLENAKNVNVITLKNKKRLLPFT